MLTRSDRQSARRPQNLRIHAQTSENLETRDARSGLRLHSQTSNGGSKLEPHELGDKIKILEFKLNDHE